MILVYYDNFFIDGNNIFWGSDVFFNWYGSLFGLVVVLFGEWIGWGRLVEGEERERDEFRIFRLGFGVYVILELR